MKMFESNSKETIIMRQPLNLNDKSTYFHKYLSADLSVLYAIIGQYFNNFAAIYWSSANLHAIKHF